MAVVADADIIFCSCGFYFLLSPSSFFAYSQQLQSGCLPYFHPWCGFSVNLECKCDMCCPRRAGNTGHKNYAKHCHLCTIAQLCQATGISSQLTHSSTIGKKLVKQQYLLHTSSQYGELRPTSGWDHWSFWDTPSNFKGFRVFVSLMHRRHSTEVNQTLHDVWPSLGLVHYIYIFGGSCP